MVREGGGRVVVMVVVWVPCEEEDREESEWKNKIKIPSNQ